MDIFKNGKIERVLGIYNKLMGGYIINKAEEALYYNVNERTIQRDIDDIRNYLELETDNSGVINLVIYDRIEKGYRVEHILKNKLSNGEVLALCKILLDSRAFTKKEMTNIIEKLIVCCVPDKNQQIINELLHNEMFHYVEPRHKTVFIDTMWKIGQAIRKNQYIEIDYYRTKDKAIVKRKIKPLAIMFSEYYFYMTAFIDDKDSARLDFDVINDSFPTIYRIDRVKKINVTDEKFHIPYYNRFEEGEFRKRIQFMYGGKLQKVEFQYCGNDVEAVLDRLPTANIISEDDGVFKIVAEVFGKGIDMWFRSQGDNISNIKFY